MLVTNPPVVLTDEPTASLDAKNVLDVTTMLVEIAHAQNATVVIAPHDDRVTAWCSHRVLAT